MCALNVSDPSQLVVGLVQSTSSKHDEVNLKSLRELVREAAETHCQLIAFPELHGRIDRELEATSGRVVHEQDEPYLQVAMELASDHKIWIHTGSVPVLSGDGTRMKNRSHLISDSGEVIARYDKVHVCDIYPVGADPILESATYEPGDHATLANTPWGGMGLAICYDVRFPGLFRAYGLAGAAVIFVPSAFSVPTGRDHWETLLRSRAIENGAFVVAPAQYGRHDDGRETWGHSIVVNPNGKVIADRQEENGLTLVTLDLGEVSRARQAVPSLANSRPFTLMHQPVEQSTG